MAIVTVTDNNHDKDKRPLLSLQPGEAFTAVLNVQPLVGRPHLSGSLLLGPSRDGVHVLPLRPLQVT